MESKFYKYRLIKREDYGWDATVIGWPQHTVQGDTQANAMLTLMFYLGLVEVEPVPISSTVSTSSTVNSRNGAEHE